MGDSTSARYGDGYGVEDRISRAKNPISASRKKIARHAQSEEQLATR